MDYINNNIAYEAVKVGYV